VFGEKQFNPMSALLRHVFILGIASSFLCSARRLTRDVSRAEGDAEYKVLSWNICWGCMEANLFDKTGMKHDLATECSKLTDKPGFPPTAHNKNLNGDNVTACADNMGGSISKFWNDIGGYDLMGFQEASNFGNFFLRSRGIVHSQIQFGADIPGVKYTSGPLEGENKKAWLVSAWNRKKLGPFSFKAEGSLTCDPGRPFLALGFDEASLIFINVHNTQPGRAAMKPCFKMVFEQIKEGLEESFNENYQRRTYRVIMVGDFNDRHEYIPGNKSMSLPWLDGALKLRKPLLKTCCSTKLSEDPKDAGDYIFDSATTAKNSIPSSYDRKLPQSDHRPVEAILGGDESGRAPSRFSSGEHNDRPGSGRGSGRQSQKAKGGKHRAKLQNKLQKDRAKLQKAGGTRMPKKKQGRGRQA